MGNNFIHGFLNICAALITLNAILFFFPPYLALKGLWYITRSVFKENVSGKVVVIAGASSGIGEHIAYEYARRGARLVVAARRINSLTDVAERAYLLGSPEVIPLRTDVSKIEDCKKLIDTTIAQFGRLDHLVNCAGVTPFSLFEDLMDVQVFVPAMDINFWGSVHTTYYAIPHLKRTKGKIIAICSAASWLPAPRMSVYNASKAAMVALFETLRVELGSTVGITIVNPGLTESEMTKGKFLSREGKMVVDQVMRDVEMSVMPIQKVGNCARAVVNSACRGDRYLTTPLWIRTSFFFVAFWPEVIQWLNRWLLLPAPGRSPTDTLSKKLLDLIDGLKKCIYPASVLSPEIKMD